MNKIQQIFGLDPEYNKKMEEQARQLHEKALAGKTCIFKTSFIVIRI